MKIGFKLITKYLLINSDKNNKKTPFLSHYYINHNIK